MALARGSEKKRFSRRCKLQRALPAQTRIKQLYVVKKIKKINVKSPKNDSRLHISNASHSSNALYSSNASHSSMAITKFKTAKASSQHIKHIIRQPLHPHGRHLLLALLHWTLGRWWWHASLNLLHPVDHLEEALEIQWRQ